MKKVKKAAIITACVVAPIVLFCVVSAAFISDWDLRETMDCLSLGALQPETKPHVYDWKPPPPTKTEIKESEMEHALKAWVNRQRSWNSRFPNLRIDPTVDARKRSGSLYLTYRYLPSEEAPRGYELSDEIEDLYRTDPSETAERARRLVPDLHVTVRIEPY